MLARSYLVVALLVFAAPGAAQAQIAGITPWYGNGNHLAVGARNGEVILMNQGGAVSRSGNALAGRPPGEWVAGFSAIAAGGSNIENFSLFAVTNTGFVVIGNAASGWGNNPGRSIFADTGRAPSEVLSMQGGTNSLVILTASGDVFEVLQASLGAYPAEYRGNIGEIPTAVFPSTWGKVKADHRK